MCMCENVYDRDPPESSNFQPQAPPSLANTSSAVPFSKSPPILLKCIRVTLFNPENESVSRHGILLLDDASNNSYISTAAAEALKLPLSPTTIRLGVFNSTHCKTISSFSTQFGLRLLNGRNLLVTATTLDQLTQPTQYIPYSPEIVNTADLVRASETVLPVVLLGSDFYYDIEPVPIQRLPSGYHLVQTSLGPLVAGKPFFFSQTGNPPQYQISNFSMQDSFPLPPSDFFSLETIGICEPPGLPTGNDIFEEFNSNIEIAEERYQVKFPFINPPETLALPTNFGLCWGRLRSTLASLTKSPSLLAQYNDIIQTQLSLGIIEEVRNSQQFSPPLHYLPHHAVVNVEKKKVRIVYDGSARLGTEKSLNDCLHPGPIILPQLVGQLIRFRLPKIVIACDIEKAFLQVSLHPTHRDCTRFLWLNNPSLPLSRDNLSIFRFTRVPFGLTCSPFLLGATILHHLSLNPSQIADEIAKNIYVDNILLSAETPTEAQAKCSSSIALFQKANMNLREFIGNSTEALSQLSPERLLITASSKFLGLNWDTDLDHLTLKISPPPLTFVPTKRSILAFLASHYDPLGFISPLLLPPKLFLQGLWSENLEWDETLPSLLTEKWHGLMKAWLPSATITVPRCPKTLTLTHHQYQLHCFSDASGSAMCSAVYLRISSLHAQTGEAHLIFSKVKVKPAHKPNSPPLTIPRLELIAALMGSRALRFVRAELPEHSLDPIVNLWSDSSAVLAWLNSPTPVREIFVRNRLSEISALPNLVVRHLPGADNPSDLGTRGVSSAEALRTSPSWWSGPPWLQKHPANWPIPPPEIKPFFSTNSKPNSTRPPSPITLYSFHINSSKIERTIDPSRFSRLPKLIRSAAYFRRFHQRIKPRSNCAFPTLQLSSTELRNALKFLLIQEQTVCPPSSMEIETLGLFTDPDGLSRSKGRLGLSGLPADTLEPLFLPPKSPLTHLIISI